MKVAKAREERLVKKSERVTRENEVLERRVESDLSTDFDTSASRSIPRR